MSTGTSGGKAENLIAGVHTIYVIDIFSTCTYTISVTLVATTLPAPVITGIITQSACGASNGAVNITVTGNAPFTYFWTYSGWATTPTTQNISNLAPGTYTVVATDANGCTATEDFIVTEDLTAAITPVYTVTNISCNGANDGGITITSFTGTFSYPVLVTTTNPSGIIIASGSINSTPLTYSGIPPGNGYTLIVTDANGCSNSSTFDIWEPPLLIFSASSQPHPCGNSTVTFSTSGGQAPYSYYYKLSSSGTWITSPLAWIQNLPDGIYDFKVVDSAGCDSLELNLNVVGGFGVILTASSITEPLCNGMSSGSVIFIADDGSADYMDNSLFSVILYKTGTSTVITTTALTVNYLGGPYGYQLSGIFAGTYDAEVTTTTGCTDTITFTINEPAAIDIIESHSDESCAPGGGDGSIDIIVSGGTPAYYFSWTKDGVAIASTSNSLGALTAGVFIVTVTDANWSDSGGDAGCTDSLTITILGDQVENTTISSLAGPTCVSGADGTFTITNTTGDFPFQVWYSRTSATTGFLQIESQVIGNSGSNQYFNSIDLANLVVDTTWTYTTTGLALSLGASQNFWIYLISTTNSCQGPTISGTIPVSLYVPMVLIPFIGDASCCDECGGYVSLAVTSGIPPYTYVWTGTGATSIINPAIYPGATTQSIWNLCPGDYTVVVTDDCGATVTDTYTITNVPVLIMDIQYQHPYCKDCLCGTISIKAEGGDGDPLVYTCNDGVHWVDTDPSSTANGPTIFNITNYNSSTVTPGTWAPGTPPGFSNLDDGIYRIWVRDHSPCSAPAFDDMVFDCHSSGGPASCLNFCVDCSSPNCYADFVNIFADHSVAPWNGGTKVELENLSTLEVTHLSHSGTSTMGGSNGSFKFTVEESYFWTGVEWYFEIYAIDPSTSALPWDSSLLSSTYGDVCCDVPGNSSCSIDCCDDIGYPFILGLTTGQGGLECITSACVGTVSTW